MSSTPPPPPSGAAQRPLPSSILLSGAGRSGTPGKRRTVAIKRRGQSEPRHVDPFEEGSSSQPLPLPPLSLQPQQRKRTVSIAGSSDGPTPRKDDTPTDSKSSRLSTSTGPASGSGGGSAVSTRPVKGKAAEVGGVPQVRIDRLLFGSVNFSAPTFVNNITNTLLFPVLLSRRDKGKGTKSNMPALDTKGIVEGARIASMLGTSGGSFQGGDDNDTDTNYATIARNLSVILENSLKDVDMLLDGEQLAVTRNEGRCRRVEVREKRQLATIRLGLEATSTRLQEYENRVSNAMAATTGIEQHLSQSNARVQRGKSVSKLLRYFRMFTKISSTDLQGMLKTLTKARVEQRAQATTQWANGDVSHSNPQYFGATGAGSPDNAADVGKKNSQLSGRRARRGDADRDGGEGEDLDNGQGKNPNVKRRTRFTRRSAPGARSNGTGSSLRGSAVGDAKASRTRKGGNNQSDDDEDEEEEDEEKSHEESNESSDEESEGDAPASPLTAQKFSAAGAARLNRAEVSAISQGLDERFAMRAYTESQVEWIQRLLLLSKELASSVSNASNVELYANWLRQELVADNAHLVDCFNTFYEEAPDAAEHHVYGRALLKTIESISKLYSTITPATEGLLTVFFKRSINDMGLTLFTEHSLKPLPPQPALPQRSNVMAMQHYTKETKTDMQRSFNFLISRVRRDLIVVESIAGNNNAARQQLLNQSMEGVVKPFISQQIKLATTYCDSTIESESQLTPRSKRRASARVADAISYAHTMQATFFSFFQKLVAALSGFLEESEAEFLGHFADAIFTKRAEYASKRAELDLLKRYHTLLEEQYTRSLQPLPDETFSLRDEHMQKTKELLNRLEEVTSRVKTYALQEDVGPYVSDLVKESLINMGKYLDGEIKKTYDSVRADRDYWRVRAKSKEELLQPTKTESQLCGFRMLLFVQSSLMSMSDTITVLSMPILSSYPRLVNDTEEAKNSAWDALDERSEKLLNLCLQAIVIRSLSILYHEQKKNDFTPQEARWGSSQENDSKDAMVAPPCTVACTLFCLYITRQFQEAREFIRLSNGQVPRRQTASQLASSATLSTVVSQSVDVGSSPLFVGGAKGGGDGFAGSSGGATISGGFSIDVAAAVKARAKTMNLQQLLYGDGGPSSVVRTLGVCLYRGVSAHLRQFSVNDKGALIYKQDVTAYREVMNPLIKTPGLGGAVVDVLFRLLKETSNLLIMPFDHIKEVKNAGLLALLSNEEKVRYMRMRTDMKEAFRRIS